MANVLQTEQIAPASRIRAATLGAALTVLVLTGGMIAGFMVGSVMLRRYIREGSLFRENAAAALGL